MAQRWIGVVALLWVSACVGGAPDTDNPSSTDSYEYVVIEGTTHPSDRVMESDEFSPQGANNPDQTDPCTCETQECLETWANQNLGCNICVALVCDNELGPHICSSCPQDPQPPQTAL